MKLDTIKDPVIQLHDIARYVESNIGVGKLSEDIRDCADRLHAITKEIYTQKNDKESSAE